MSQSTLKDRYVIDTLDKWQLDARTKTRGVFVSSFKLYSQYQGFGLDVEVSVDGKNDNEWGTPRKTFFGESVYDVVVRALEYIRLEKQELIEALND